MSGSEEVKSLTDPESNESSYIKVLLNEIEDVGVVQLFANEPWAHTSNEDEDSEVPLFRGHDSGRWSHRKLLVAKPWNNYRTSGVTAGYYPATSDALLSKVHTRYAVRNWFKFERNVMKWLGGRRREVNSSLRHYYDRNGYELRNVEIDWSVIGILRSGYAVRLVTGESNWR